MAGFFPRVGGSPSGYSPLPMTTLGTILDDIVSDVATQAGTNGWSLHDDQRVGYTPLIIPSNLGGLTNVITNSYVTMTNGSATMSQNSLAGRMHMNWGGAASVGAGNNYVSNDQTNWYTVISWQSQASVTLDRNFTGTTATNIHPLYEKSLGYIVLKCTSTQKTFYLLILRPVSTGYSLRFQVYETWNASTHTGTAAGPMENLRTAPGTYLGSFSLPIQYVLFLLPDTFAMWVGGDPSNASSGSDFFYAGNLTPLRTGDTNALIQACSNQDLSGICADNVPTYSTANSFVGGASCLRNVAGQVWNTALTQANYSGVNNYAIIPRGTSYIFGIDRTNLDESAKFQFTECDAYYGGPGDLAFNKNEGKRGELKYLKHPVMNPTGMHLASLGPADDGNTYMLMRASYPSLWAGAYNTFCGDAIAGRYMSGFSFSWRSNSSAIGELLVPSVGVSIIPRWFMMPINL